MTEPEISENKFQTILRRVRGLLAKADHPNTPAAEAESYRLKAEELIHRYRIEESETLAQDPQALAPEFATIEICEAARDEFATEFHIMWYHISNHVGLEYHAVYLSSGLSAIACGFPIDLRLADLIYTNARRAFSARLSPTVDPDATEADNIYRLRSGGLTRGRIAELLWGGQTHARNARVADVYKAECLRRGETPALDGRGTSAALHRKLYAKEFVTEIGRRLLAARSGVDKLGGAVQLAGREERVAEAYYGRYPERRPSNAVAVREDCGKCTDQRKCRQHKARSLTKADRKRVDREHYSATAVAARAAGRRAAADVALDGAEPVRRLDDRTPQERDDERQIRGAIGG